MVPAQPMTRPSANIRDFPEDPRFRRVRLGSSARLRETLRSPAAAKLLQLVGFRADAVGDLVLGTGQGGMVPPALLALQAACRRLEQQADRPEHASQALERLPPEPEQGTDRHFLY